MTVTLCNVSLDSARGVRLMGRRIDAQADSVCESQDNGFKCNSCRSYSICVGATQIGNNTCEPPMKYCDPILNQCSSVAPPFCEPRWSFICTAEGTFPNPTDCQTYVLCDDTKQPIVYQCPRGYVYDITKQICLRKVEERECVTMICMKPNEVIVHPTHPNVWAFCDQSLTATLFKCPPNMVYEAGCRYVCRGEGYFPGKNKSEAYHCSWSGTLWKINIYNCPVGYEFNSMFLCVKIVSV